ncbi:MAG TPA: alpha/beta hydrolase, partial [Herpetosiphonaceae bacterium]|nr:alpha/beta hydrolase [Herpetosiphonaceae bacterium]
MIEQKQADGSPAGEHPVWTHHEAIVNGVRLHYVEAGAGPLVVLLHGFPDFWYGWRYQIGALAAAGYRVIAPDMRGYNLSEKPPGVLAYHIRHLTGDVAGLLRMFGGEQGGYLAGHDWGGVVAWHTARLHPELVRKLAILNAPHPNRYLEVLREVPAQRRRSWYIGFFQLPWLPELLLPRTTAQVERFFRISGGDAPSFIREDARLYAEALNQPGAKTAMVNYYRSLFRRTVAIHVRELPHQLSMPVLLLWGKQDVALELANADPEKLRRWAPNLRVELL